MLEGLPLPNLTARWRTSRATKRRAAQRELLIQSRTAPSGDLNPDLTGELRRFRASDVRREATARLFENLARVAARGLPSAK
jgi:hypothetical protein